MKYTSTPFAALAAIALTGSAYAATINWQLPQEISGPSDVNTQGTSVLAHDFGFNPSTVNGVTFTTTTPGYASSFQASNPGGWGIGSFIGTNDADGQSYADLLNSGHYNTTNPTATITLSALTVGQEYLVQYWVADYRMDWWAAELRQATLTGGSNTSAPLSYMDNDGPIQGSFVIGTFIADSDIQTITVSANVPPQINAFQLRAIPEPSAALLGGLGMLALLRRRR